MILALCAAGAALAVIGCGGGGGTTATSTPAALSADQELTEVSKAIETQNAAWTPAMNPVAQLSDAEQDALNGAVDEAPAAARAWAAAARARPQRRCRPLLTGRIKAA